ncbi:PIN domain-containing protein [Candidatus Woesearchaeota archaeon]|nr:PIN domain-containing protein [Candidatus Woesearchaeota archaeon]
MIFDTSFIIDLMRNKKEAVDKLKEIKSKGDTQTTTALSIFELFTGLAISKKPAEEKNKIISALEGQIVIPLEKESAAKAGEIDGTLIKEGNAIGLIDSMIAGIALIKKEKVLTRNAKDFSKVKGLEIETY